jgi:hypothetical protein
VAQSPAHAARARQFDFVAAPLRGWSPRLAIRIFSNIGVSLLEDGFVVFMLWLSATHPVVFGIALLLSIALAIMLLALLFKFLRVVARRLADFFSGHAPRLSYVQENPDRQPR